jgi:tubulin-specific chaperone E
MPATSDFYPGKRLSLGERLCTVRYVGEVQGTQGEWLGVEWDDPSRGKHSGEHGGIRYFQCSRLPKLSKI